MKISVPPLTPHERAQVWVSNNHYAISKARQSRSHHWFAEPDGRVIEVDDDEKTIGSWRMVDFNIVIEIEDY